MLSLSLSSRGSTMTRARRPVCGVCGVGVDSSTVRGCRRPGIAPDVRGGDELGPGHWPRLGLRLRSRLDSTRESNRSDSVTRFMSRTPGPMITLYQCQVAIKLQRCRTLSRLRALSSSSFKFVRNLKVQPAAGPGAGGAPSGGSGSARLVVIRLAGSGSEH